MSKSSTFSLRSCLGEASHLKIAIIAHLKYPIAEPFSGGLEMHTHLIASKLSNRGHTVKLFAAEGSISAEVASICCPTGPMECDPTRSPMIEAIEHSAYSAMIAMLRDEDFDIIHFNALHYLPLQHLATLSAPVVAVLHTPPFEPLAAAIGEVQDDMTCVSVSESLASQWPVLSSCPTIIDNGIDLTRFPFRPSGPGETFAVWSGRIVPEKGLHLAIEAARLAAIPLKIVGPISDRAYWVAEVEPQLDDNVVYIGHLEQSELAKVLGLASVAICTPRWEEPFGLVVVEALACGTPVAGFARGALPEILDETCGTLVPADDVEALAKGIRRCLGLDRGACRNRAEARFDAELMIDRYESLYFDIIAAQALTPALVMGLCDGAEA